MIPGITQFIQGDGHGAECCCWFALEKAKTFGQLVGNQVSQTHVVGKHHQTDTVQGIFGGDPHGHIASDDGNFGLKVNAKGFVAAKHRVARPHEIITAALVHEWVGVKTVRHFRAARCAHQLHMVQIG